MAEKKFYDIAAAKEVLSDPGTEIISLTQTGLLQTVRQTPDCL